VSYTLFTNSTDGISFDPDFGFKHRDKKIQNSIRVRSGLGFVYKFGDYKRWKIPLRFVGSADKKTLNDWWSNNTELFFYDDNDTTAASTSTVRIANRASPVSQPEKPYDYEWKGSLELEEY